MLIGKAHRQGSLHELDANGVSLDIVYMTELQSASLLPAMDSLYTNPDGPSVRIESIPGMDAGAPNGNPQAGRNASRRGRIHRTGVSTVPSSNPFPRPGAPATRTRTLTIAV